MKKFDRRPRGHDVSPSECGGMGKNMLKRIRRPARPTVETKLGSLEDARNGMLNLAFLR